MSTIKTLNTLFQRSLSSVPILAAMWLIAGCDRSRDARPSKSNIEAAQSAAQESVGGNTAESSLADEPRPVDSSELTSRSADAQRKPSGDDPAGEVEHEPVETPAGEQPWISAEQLPWQASFLQYISNTRTGYTLIEVFPPMLEGSKQIRIRRQDSIEFVRAGHMSRVETVFESVETLDGRLLELTESTTNGASVTTTEGSLRGANLNLTTTLGETSKTQSIRLEPGTWGVLGVQAILMQKVMVPGEQRAAKLYLHQNRQLVDVKLTALEPELTAVTDGTKSELMPVDVVMIANADNGIRSRVWVNATGEIQKTVTLSGMSVNTFRTTRDVVQRMQDGYRIDALREFEAPLAGGVPLEEGVEQVMYMVEANGEDPFTIFPSSGNQSVQSATARRAAVLVNAWSNADFPQTDPPPELSDYASPSSFVQSNSETIAKLATEWGGEELDQAELTLQLAAAVQQKLEPVSEFSSHFESASEVVHSLKGDCTEHAVLLAALLRNRGIPARVASGLRVDPESPERLVFHMWTEAWLEDHWLPVDGMTGRVTGPGYIKFLDSALASENPFEIVMPVLDHLPNLQFGVSSIEQ